MKSRFDWRAAYFHLVSLVGIVVLIIAAITAGHGVLKLAFPALSVDQYNWERIQSFESYKRSLDPDRVKSSRRPVVASDSIEAERGDISDDELRRQWQEERGLLIEGQRRTGLWSLVESLVTAIVVMPIFWWHRRAAKMLKEPETDEEPSK
jgi:hypothetical protein